MARYGSTAAKKLDDLIDDIGAKLSENTATESAQDEGEPLSYADKVRAQLHAVHGYGTAAYQNLVLKTMVEQAKDVASDDQAEDEVESKRYGSTTAKRLDDWITLTASKLTEAEDEETDVSLADESGDGGLEAHARARQQAHAYGTTDYQRRVWLDMVENAKDAEDDSTDSSEGGQGSNGQQDSNEQQNAQAEETPEPEAESAAKARAKAK